MQLEHWLSFHVPPTSRRLPALARFAAIFLHLRRAVFAGWSIVSIPGNAEGGVCAEHPGHFGSQHRSVSKCSLPAVFYRQIQELVMKCDESIFQQGLAHKDVNGLPLSGFRRLATRQKRRSTTRCRSHCS